MATLDTVATRADGTSFPAGKAYFETSTNKFIVWNGESWIELHSDGVGAIDAYNIDIVDTEANILASTGYPEGTIARVTNSSKLYVYQGGVWYVFNAEPFSQYSLSFDGSDDYLTMSPVTPSAQQGTVSAWIKTSTTATKEVLCQTNTTSDTTYLFLSIDSGGYPRLGWQSGSSRLFKRGSTQVNDGNWHHVAYISDGSAWKIYVDGADEGTLTTVVSGGASDGSWYGDLPSINALRIGCQERNLGTTSFFNGNIDEVAIFNSALTSEQVASLIDTSGSNPVPANISSLNPSAWWRMGDDANDTFVDGGSVASITDSSGNGNTATQATAANQPTFSTSVPA